MNPYLIEKQKKNTTYNVSQKDPFNDFSLLKLFFNVPEKYQRILNKKVSIGQLLTVLGVSIIGGTSFLLYTKTRNMIKRVQKAS